MSTLRIAKWLCLLFLLPVYAATAQTDYNATGWLPEREMHLVYDYYGLLTEGQKDTLETRLVAFNDSTSNQIVVMITPGFGGRDISSFAFEVGDKWGIGQRKLRNGVIIVVKPKDDTDGEVEIAPGHGLEGALPDIFCKRIIEDQMIPHFREEDYYGGIVAALDIILPVCAGEYSFDKYKEDREGGSAWLGLLFLGLIFFFVIRSFRKGSSGGGHYSGGSGSTLYGGSSSSYDSWSSGSSGHSSSSGGFGGFGGGSFGGGGASGRW